MQNQLAGGQSDLQQQSSNLQQTQSNLQQNAGSAGSYSGSSAVLSQPDTGQQLQVQNQGTPATTPTPNALPDNGVSVLMVLLVILPAVIALAAYALLRPRPAQTEVADQFEQFSEPVAEAPVNKTVVKKSKKKQSRSKRSKK